MSGAAAIVLAAGEGRRMGGKAKGGLRLPDGRTFVAAIVECAREAGCEEVIVVVGPPHEEEMRAEAEAAGAVVVRNGEPGRGMVSSLAEGLVLLERGSGYGIRGSGPGVGVGVGVALAWPVDHPRVKVETVRAILAAATVERVVVPFYGGRGGHPTAFGRDHWPALLALPVGGARAVVASRPELVDCLVVGDPGVVIDVDTPADYDKIK